MNKNQFKKLFFALWPDQSVVQKIAQRAVPHLINCQGRLLKPHNWHITLAYYGAADESTQFCLEQQATNVKSLPFQLSLNQLGYWSKPKVSWLAPEHIPRPLNLLVNELQGLIISCGYKVDDRAYQPHVSLLRKAKNAPADLEITEINMSVENFCLVESLTTNAGAEYKILRRWQLTL